MRTVYVLTYTGKAIGPDREVHDAPMIYAVFEDSKTAEKMKRDGDGIIEVPYFEDPTEMLMQAVERRKAEGLPLTDNAHITWTRSPWGREDSTLAPPDYNTYPRVTCNKTIDEHTWRDRSD